jgi:hypothetical protein
MIIEHDADGRITHVISDPVMPEVRAHYLAAGAIEATGARCGLDTHYVVDGAIKERPAPKVQIAIDGRTIRISNVPQGSAIKVEIEGQTVETSDKTIELDEAGPVSVTVAPPWPMMEVRHDLEVE